ncbi:NAD(P)-binding domain-containing protein [bacterium]|nr:NAD(P)-binding domain-containing protein [bacterium]
MRILNTIGEIYTDRAKNILSSLGDVHYKTLSQNELVSVISNYEGVVIGLGLTFDENVLKNGDKLKFIATATTGLDHIDTEYAKKRGIAILSLRGENDFLDTITGTAELAWGLLIALSRHLPQSIDSVKAHEWDREKFRGHNLYGRTLGVVGLGRLGRWTARYGNAFGMRVIACDPRIPRSAFAEAHAVPKTFDELISESDVVSIHVHLSDETKNMFNGDVFKKMKPEAYLINTSRGAIVNEPDLLSALEKGVIAGYGADVLADETSFGKTFKSNPLVEYAKTHSNVILLPHTGGMTHESREATDIFIAEKVAKFAKT